MECRGRFNERDPNQFAAFPNGFCPIGKSCESRSSMSRARESRSFSGFHFCKSHIAQPEVNPSIRTRRQILPDKWIRERNNSASPRLDSLKRRSLSNRACAGNSSYLGYHGQLASSAKEHLPITTSRVSLCARSFASRGAGNATSQSSRCFVRALASAVSRAPCSSLALRLAPAAAG